MREVRMPTFKDILFPVDFSPRCAQVAPLVRSWTHHFNANLTLIHAMSFLYGPEDTYSGQLQAELHKNLQEFAERSMQDFLRRHFSTFPLEYTIDEGDPARVIVDHARKCGTDLIMMPTHGYGPFRRFLIGSVTGKVLHDAMCPVWTAAHTTEAPPTAGETCQNILCAVDTNGGALQLIRSAMWLARRYQASLKLVHVIPAVDETSQNRGEKELRRYLTERARNEFAPILKEAGSKEAGSAPELLLRGGNVARTLAATVRKVNADLLVIGRGHLQKRLGRLRTQTMAIICESPCPVLSF
jgi:nucleotide-binding universal stress UspA family protein